MNTHLSRRKFLQHTSGITALGLAPVAWAKTIPAETSELTNQGLSFLNLHTGERLITDIHHADATSFTDMRKVNHLLRDHRSGESYDMDPELLHFLSQLQEKVDVPGKFHIISGYRSPKTNAKLRSASKGVAKRSLHMQGKAVDIRLPGCDLKQLRDAAKSLKCGGVGYYAKSGFIHVDTGRARYW
jgi:uncharacterized protein YcbK (DUF882 family)